MDKQPVVKVEGLIKEYKMYSQPRDVLLEMFGRKPRHKAKRVLDGISFELYRGDVMGIIGRNGAGKSTLLKILAGTLDKTAGNINVMGDISAILELGTGFHPEYTGRDNIIMGGMSIGMSRKEMEEKSSSIIEFAELGEAIDQPFKTYSSGMQARLTFSTAISVQPDVFIVDEALAAGDAFFVSKCLNRISEICNSGATVLFVSHSIDMVRRLCNRAIYLENGRIVSIGDSVSVCAEYEMLTMAEQSRLIRLAAQKNGKRIDSDSMRIDNITIHDVAGTETYAFYQHDSVVLRFRISTMKKIESPTINVKVMRSDGILVTSWLSSEPKCYSVGDLEPGDHTIELKIDDLLLGDGGFFLSVYFFAKRPPNADYFFVDPLAVWENVVMIDVRRRTRSLSTFFDQEFVVDTVNGIPASCAVPEVKNGGIYEDEP